MKITLIAIFMFFTISGFLFAGGSVCINDDPQAQCRIINLNDQDIQALVARDDPVLIFKKRTDTLNNVSSGDLLVAGASKEIPDGFIRKVVSIRTEKERVVVETVQGRLEDMLGARVGSAAPAKPKPPKKNE